MATICDYFTIHKTIIHENQELQKINKITNILYQENLELYSVWEYCEQVNMEFLSVYNSVGNEQQILRHLL